MASVDDEESRYVFRGVTISTHELILSIISVMGEDQNVRSACGGIQNVMVTKDFSIELTEIRAIPFGASFNRELLLLSLLPTMHHMG